MKFLFRIKDIIFYFNKRNRYDPAIQATRKEFIEKRDSFRKSHAELKQDIYGVS